MNSAPSMMYIAARQNIVFTSQSTAATGLFRVTKATADKYKLTFPLLSDFNKEVIRQYGVVNPDMIGLKDIAKRSVFVIDTTGVVRHAEVLENGEPQAITTFSLASELDPAWLAHAWRTFAWGAENMRRRDGAYRWVLDREELSALYRVRWNSLTELGQISPFAPKHVPQLPAIFGVRCRERGDQICNAREHPRCLRAKLARSGARWRAGRRLDRPVP